MNSILFLVVDSVIFENLLFSLFIVKLTMASCSFWVLDRWWLGRPLVYRCLLRMVDNEPRQLKNTTPCCRPLKNINTFFLYRRPQVLQHQVSRVLNWNILCSVLGNMGKYFFFFTWSCESFHILLFVHLLFITDIYVQIIYCLVNCGSCCCWVLYRWWLGRPREYRCLLSLVDTKQQRRRLTAQRSQHTQHLLTTPRLPRTTPPSRLPQPTTPTLSSTSLQATTKLRLLFTTPRPPSITLQPNGWYSVSSSSFVSIYLLYCFFFFNLPVIDEINVQIIYLQLTMASCCCWLLNP